MSAAHNEKSSLAHNSELYSKVEDDERSLKATDLFFFDLGLPLGTDYAAGIG
jgi:hypothetical protein